MSRLGRAVAVVLMTLALNAAAADSDAAVVHVGKSTATVGDVERAMARVPSFQLRTLGDTTAAVRRRFLDNVLVPDMLFDEEARERRTRDPQWMLSDLRDAHRRALVEHLRAQLSKDEPVTEADVAKYYAANLREFQSEPRLRIFRILVGNQSDCSQVSSQVHGAGGLEKWTAFAREHSLDTATRLRGGDLGFVRPDGATDVPQVRVDPALYAAAARVRDGDLVEEPIAEGSQFACVWRRGSAPAARQSLEQARGAIVQVLERERLQAALNRLLEGLRQKQVTELHADLIDQVPTAPNVSPASSGSSAKIITPVASTFPVPARTDRGLR